jgi:hypothetical protein
VTCAECTDALLEADLTSADLESERQLSPIGPEAREHIATCSRCGGIAGVLLESQSALSRALETHGDQHPDALAVSVYRRYRRERIVRTVVVPAGILALVLAAAILVGNFGRTLQRFFAPPPAVETVTFSLSCLSAQQAATLLRPYLPRPQNPMWQAESFDIAPAGGGIKAVTVRAPEAMIAHVPELLARFEADPRAACRFSR